jgi:hypothetical protein
MEKRILKRQPAQLLTVQGRQISSKVGTYSNDVTMALIKENQDKIHSVRDIARVQFGRLTRANEERVRKEISRAVRALQSANILAYALYESEGHHKVTGCRVYQGTAQDRIDFPIYLNQARARKEISEARYQELKELEQATGLTPIP